MVHLGSTCGISVTEAREQSLPEHMHQVKTQLNGQNRHWRLAATGWPWRT